MLGVYTEETFNSLTKRHIIDLFLKIQKHTNTTISKLRDEIRNLNANIKRLESDIQACEKVNDALVKHVASVERQCWRNALYSRRERAEVIGMSNWIVHSVLEKTVCKPLQHIGADIFEEKLESYLLLNQKKRSDDSENSWTKNSEQVIKVKKRLKDLNPTD